jgi:putative resolvase
MKTYSIAELAKIVHRSVRTLQTWDRKKILVAKRTPTNRRYYTQEQLNNYFGLRPVETERKIIAYCRVSSATQKPDLKNQQRTLEQFCAARGLANVEFISEIGGGLNFKRKKFVALMDAIVRGEVSTLVIAHKDRLCRFGFDWFEHVCKENRCTLLVLNTEKLSPEQEMVQDLMTIVHCFSSRLYGLRNYRKKLAAALKEKGA